MQQGTQPSLLAVGSTLAILSFSSAQAMSASEPARLDVVEIRQCAVDERFQSFQIGMSHLTDGDTWISYDAMG